MSDSRAPYALEAPVERLRSRRRALERLQELREEGFSVMGPQGLR